MSREAAALGMVVAPVLDLSYSKFYDLGSLRSLSGCSTWCALAGSGAFSWLPHARRFHQPPIHLADHMLCLWDMTGLMGKLSMEICWLSTPLLCSELDFPAVSGEARSQVPRRTCSCTDPRQVHEAFSYLRQRPCSPHRFGISSHLGMAKQKPG